MAQITSPIKPSYYLLIEQCFSQDETPLVVESSLEMVVQLCQTELEKGIQELAEVWSGALGERIPLIALRVLDMVSQLHNDKQEDDSPEMEERRRVAAHTVSLRINK